MSRRLIATVVALALIPIVATGPVFAQPAPPSDDGPARVTVPMEAASPWSDAINEKVEAIMPDVISWRRDIHEHPELSNRETRTAAKIAEHLRSLDIDVETGVAHTGVVGVLEGGTPGPVVGLRADMDALPVKERVDVPFASTATSTYNGETVPVMHACGHDTHVAMLMGVAEVLASLRDELPGTVKFIFQPAEEGAPEGEEGGADLMIAEGALQNPDVDVMFGLHIHSKTEVGTINYRPGSIMAASDVFRITVKGKQTHGSTPWEGVDPVVTASQIVNGLQTVVSRRSELTNEAAVVSVGKIEGGVRSNIIPEEVKMVGTIRTLDTEMQKRVHAEIRRTATNIAKSQGATADVEIDTGYPVTKNDPALTERMAPTLQRVADTTQVINPITGAEDFSYFQRKVPGLYFFVGGMPRGTNPSEAAPHHTPDFYIDESGMPYGVRALSHLTADYLASQSGE
jgi:amidohydrolase